MIRPPMTAIASGCCICAPGPMPRARGTSPRIVHRLVMRIGRNRVRPARIRASCSGIPSARSWPMYSIRMISFFTSRPISRIAPMNDETFSGVPVIQSANSALDQGDRLNKEEPDRQDHAPELKSHQEEHERRRHDQDRQQAGERLLLRPVATRQLPAISGRERELGKLLRADRG